MVTSVSVFAGSPGGIPFELMNKGAGIRILSMGGAGTSNNNGVESVYWNPAVLDKLNRNEIYMSLETFFDGANYDYVSYAGPAGVYGGVGLAVGIMNYGSYKRVDSEGFSLGDDGYMRDTFVTAAYGKSVFGGLNAGASLKVLLRSMEDDMYTAFNADVSIYSDFGADAGMGIVFRNVIPVSVEYGLDSEKFVHSARLGFDISFFEKKLNAAVDVEKYFIDSPAVLYGGLEYNIGGMISLRAGGNTNTEFGGGLGISYEEINFDYGVVYNELVLSHKFALSYKFGGYRLYLKADPGVFSPLGGNKKTYIRVRANTKYEIFKWKIEIKDSGGNIVEEWHGAGKPDDKVVWDGLREDGLPCEEGRYRAVLTVVNENDTVIVSEPTEIILSAADRYNIPLFD